MFFFCLYCRVHPTLMPSRRKMSWREWPNLTANLHVELWITIKEVKCIHVWFLFLFLYDAVLISLVFRVG